MESSCRMLRPLFAGTRRSQSSDMPFAAGVLRRTDAPPARELVESLTAGFPDAVHEEVRPVSAIAAGDARIAELPPVHPFVANGFVVSWAGRLDNLPDCARR